MEPKFEWLEFEALEGFPHVVHGVFLRHLNLGLVPDREKVQKKWEMPRLVFPTQTHGCHVERITARNWDKAPQADAIFTTERNVAIGVTHADCQAAIFYDPVHEAIGVVHAGWRGLVQNIYSRMFESMKREIGTQPQNLIVCIAPSLGPDHAEYKNYRQEFPQEFWQFQAKPNHFNFWDISRRQLAQIGILDKNIEITEVCTHCNPDDCYSYRRDKDTARHGTIVALKG